MEIGLLSVPHYVEPSYSMPRAIGCATLLERSRPRGRARVVPGRLPAPLSSDDEVVVLRAAFPLAPVRDVPVFEWEVPVFDNSQVVVLRAPLPLARGSRSDGGVGFGSCIDVWVDG